MSACAHVWYVEPTSVTGYLSHQSLPYCLRQDLSLNLALISAANCLGNEQQASSI